MDINTSRVCQHCGYPINPGQPSHAGCDAKRIAELERAVRSAYGSVTLAKEKLECYLEAHGNCQQGCQLRMGYPRSGGAAVGPHPSTGPRPNRF